jgi:hypothetical protein
VKQSEFDDHPRYDDLIRELHELKRFIEAQGEYSPSRDPEAAASRERILPKTEGMATTGSVPPPPVDDAEDAPPVLRQVIRRNPPEDTGQLDLLSVTSGNRDSVTASQRPANVPQPGSGHGDKERVDLETTGRASTVESSAAQETGDEEVLEFVYDLADRILATLEDKLLERSGELLPDDLRGELRESIGDMLYEWCER